MAYSHRDIAQEQKEAYQKAQQITAICEQLQITLDPIDWQNAGMRAGVSVNMLEISDLLDLGQQDSASILRRVRIKLLEHAALQALRARPGCKAVMWSPVDVVQPQAFLSLWIITLETDERVAIAEYVKDGQRVYEPYVFDMNDSEALAGLFGPAHTGEYQPGDTVMIEERDHRRTGEIVHVLAPGKALSHRKLSPKARQPMQGRGYASEDVARYIVDCHDGFPHVVNQWQIIIETGVKAGVDGTEGSQAGPG